MDPTSLKHSPRSSSDPVSFLDSPWKRFQRRDLDPHLPLLTLDDDGTIVDVTRAALHALEYGGETKLDPCFFTHVNGKNLRRVMQDLAMMVCGRKTRASWLLRLRTGSGRWRWYRALAQANADDETPRIRVRLRRV